MFILSEHLSGVSAFLFILNFVLFLFVCLFGWFFFVFFLGGGGVWLTIVSFYCMHFFELRFIHIDILCSEALLTDED